MLSLSFLLSVKTLCSSVYILGKINDVLEYQLGT